MFLSEYFVQRITGSSGCIRCSIVGNPRAEERYDVVIKTKVTAVGQRQDGSQAQY